MTAENELNITRVSKLRIQLRQARFQDGSEEGGELKTQDGLATLRKRLKDRLMA